MKNLILSFLMLVSFNIQAHKEIADEYLNCGLTSPAKELAELIITSTKQLKRKLTCNLDLAHLANNKAKKMAIADRIAHNIEHVTPNEFSRKHGIKLPRNCDIIGN